MDLFLMRVLCPQNNVLMLLILDTISLYCVLVYRSSVCAHCSASLVTASGHIIANILLNYPTIIHAIASSTFSVLNV